MVALTTYGSRQLSNGMTRVRCDIQADTPPADMPFYGAEVDGLDDMLEIDTGSTLHVLDPEAHWIMGQDMAWYEMPAQGGGGGVSLPLDPVDVYKKVRPADWWPMPTEPGYMWAIMIEPADSKVRFKCTGTSVVLGHMDGSEFVADAEAVTGEDTMINTADFENFGILPDGNVQIMVRISGSEVYISYVNVVDIYIDNSGATKINVPNTVKFASIVSSGMTNMNGMFGDCKSLIAIPQLNTSGVTNMQYMFRNCNSLIAIPQFDTSRVTSMSNMFIYCNNLITIPQFDTSSVTDMTYMFYGCYSLIAIPQLDTSSVTNMSAMFYGCLGLVFIRRLNTGSVKELNCMNNMLYQCRSVTDVTFDPTIENWKGSNIYVSSCWLDHDAIIRLFESLPTITSAKNLTITNNPGADGLKESEIAIATERNWTVVGATNIVDDVTTDSVEEAVG